MADEIILMHPLHDDDDGTVPLVIEPAVEGMAERVVGRLPLRIGQRPSGRNGSSIRMMSPPRPISIPPLEVARRYP
jgi:hypothetical protein